MNHIMLDLETMSTLPNAAITSIGACVFDFSDGPIDHKFYSPVSLKSSKAAGLDIDTGTIEWWMQQSDEARQQTFGAFDKPALGTALEKFNDWVRGFGVVGVWGNGATFDNVVIRSAMRACGIDPCWSFRADKCYRTVSTLLPPHMRPEFVRHGTFHNALDDAISQALHLREVMKVLEGRTISLKVENYIATPDQAAA